MLKLTERGVCKLSTVLLVVLLRREVHVTPTVSRDILSARRLAILVCHSCPPYDTTLPPASSTWHPRAMGDVVRGESFGSRGGGGFRADLARRFDRDKDLYSSTPKFILVEAPWWMAISFHLCLSTSNSKVEKAGNLAYDICSSVVPREVVHVHHSLVEQLLVLCRRNALGEKGRTAAIYTPWGRVPLRKMPRSSFAGHALASAVTGIRAVIEIWRWAKP